MQTYEPSQKVTALVTILDEPYGTEIRRLWNRFQVECGVENSLASNPIPHFSWQGAESYHSPEINEVVQHMAGLAQPFTVRTSGIGLFTGSSLVVYLALVKNQALSDLHARLWEQTHELAVQPNLYYHPDCWMPHITLAKEPMDFPSLTCILKKVVFLSFDWEIPIDHFAIIHGGTPASLAPEIVSDFQEQKRYNFGG